MHAWPRHHHIHHRGMEKKLLQQSLSTVCCDPPPKCHWIFFDWDLFMYVLYAPNRLFPHERERERETHASSAARFLGLCLVSFINSLEDTTPRVIGDLVRVL